MLLANYNTNKSRYQNYWHCAKNHVSYAIKGNKENVMFQKLQTLAKKIVELRPLWRQDSRGFRSASLQPLTRDQLPHWDGRTDPSPEHLLKCLCSRWIQLVGVGIDWDVVTFWRQHGYEQSGQRLAGSGQRNGEWWLLNRRRPCLNDAYEWHTKRTTCGRF